MINASLKNPKKIIPDSKLLDLEKDVFEPEPSKSDVKAGIEMFEENGSQVCRGFCLREDIGKFGFENYSLRLQVDGKTHEISQYRVESLTLQSARITADLSPSVCVVVDWHHLDDGRTFLLKVQVRNSGGESITIEKVAFGQFGATAQFHPSKGHVLGWGLRYLHTGNLRTERYPFCAADYPYIRQLPIDTRVLGDTEDQPFPALFVYNEITKWGIIFATTAQSRSVPVFTFKRNALFRPDVFSEFHVDWGLPQSKGIVLESGDSTELEPLYLQMTEGIEPDVIFEDYLEYLAGENTFRGSTSPANDWALHCTWNYGVFANQRAEPLLKTASFIAKNFPKIKFFLVDDGYLTHTVETTRVYLNRFYPDPEQEVSETTWPGGMKAFTAKVRQRGLRPGIWWTPTVRLPCLLHDEHPDWFLRKGDESLYLIGSDCAYLDYSHPEALAFLDRTLEVILGKWDMDACKIDFWSQNFETQDAVLYDPKMTAVEMRRRFFEVVRAHLPSDGLIMSCIAMGMGNPFLGEFVDTYRCSMDISGGLWEDQIGNCLWTLPLLGLGGRRSLLLNTDSVGINLSLPDNENLFRLTWCYITMGLIETGGRLEELPPFYLKAMKKLTDRCDRGYPCRCSDKRAFTGVPLPDSLYVDFPEDSPTAQKGIRQSVALFNWDDQAKLVTINRRDLGQAESVDAEDFWSGATEQWASPYLVVELEPRTAQLFDVRW